MSAWAQMVNSDGSDEHLELCNRALIEIQTEHARQLAGQMRAHLSGLGLSESSPEYHYAETLLDLIDPKEK